MQDNKEKEIMPELTLFPFEEEKEEIAEEKKDESQEWTDQILSEEERRIVDQFAEQIDLNNSSMILQYGAGTQKKMADFSESALDKVQTKDLGEVGKLLTNLTVELKSFDASEEKKVFGFF